VGEAQAPVHGGAEAEVRGPVRRAPRRGLRPLRGQPGAAPAAEPVAPLHLFSVQAPGGRVPVPGGDPAARPVAGPRRADRGHRGREAEALL